MKSLSDPIQRDVGRVTVMVMVMQLGLGCATKPVACDEGGRCGKGQQTTLEACDKGEFSSPPTRNEAEACSEAIEKARRERRAERHIVRARRAAKAKNGPLAERHIGIAMWELSRIEEDAAPEHVRQYVVRDPLPLSKLTGAERAAVESIRGVVSISDGKVERLLERGESCLVTDATILIGAAEGSAVVRTSPHDGGGDGDGGKDGDGGGVQEHRAPEPCFVTDRGPDPEALEVKGNYEQLSGDWDSGYGRVSLRFDKQKFKGKYPNGCIFDGKVQQMTGELTFTWKDSDGGDHGLGRFEIKDLKTLRGTWGRGDSSNNGGNWDLSREDWSKSDGEVCHDSDSGDDDGDSGDGDGDSGDGHSGDGDPA